MTSITKVFFLGGPVFEWPRIEEMFKEFWSRYAFVDNDAPPPHPEATIRVLLHGDEGRGQAKQPILVISYQPIIGWRGEHRLNSKESLVCNTEQAISIPKNDPST